MPSARRTASIALAFAVAGAGTLTLAGASGAGAAAERPAAASAVPGGDRLADRARQLDLLGDAVSSVSELVGDVLRSPDGRLSREEADDHREDVLEELHRLEAALGRADGRPADAVAAPAVPTGVPTNLPTGVPSNLPTGVPTGPPSGLPENIPTGPPTCLPITLPTGVPGLPALPIPPCDSSAGPGGARPAPAGVPDRGTAAALTTLEEVRKQVATLFAAAEAGDAGRVAEQADGLLARLQKLIGSLLGGGTGGTGTTGGDASGTRQRS
ncbi:hypothetical protein V1J52_04150 [Streptomyces sp. TRM 70351]|uniref:hypothetical protein n=1 Tax=Streptomyces sp. TRM 70351 TaxID=3116552 RepID=UPI002E7B6B32|nr:hypothetical protein [Streptomyces sp. TRM 70351]MEE1927382.1 hypothetical protein [Streptomyces sp. TRM 70351]